MAKTRSGGDVFEDAKLAAKHLKSQEVQYLFRMYDYFLNERVAIQSRIRTLPEVPNKALTFMLEEVKAREDNIRAILDEFTSSHPVGQQIKKIKGIGPVISAGLIAHIDMDIAQHVAQILAYGGYTEKAVWRKGEKRNFNMGFKKVLINLGRSFLFSSGYPDSYFGWQYKLLKARIIGLNETGAFKEKCEWKLANYNFDKTTTTYKSYVKGKLPPSHIIALAKFKTVSLFLGIMHTYWSTVVLGRNMVPYPFYILKHDVTLMKTLQEVLDFEEQKRREVIVVGDRKKVEVYEEYLIWKEHYAEANPHVISDIEAQIRELEQQEMQGKLEGEGNVEDI